jgi:hypothetical protein
MGGCVIDLTHEYDVPWEKVVVSYIHRMENEADGEVERRDVKVTVAPPPVSSVDASIDGSDPGDSPSSCEEEDEPPVAADDEEERAVDAEGRTAIDVGDRVRLTAEGERCHPDGCLAPGGIGAVLARGKLAAHHRSWDTTVSKLRVQALGGSKRVYWYPCSALQLEHGPPPVASQVVEPEAAATEPAEAAAAQSSHTAATWAYAIDYAMPWIFRKLFSLDKLQLATTERLDMQERVLENTMVNVSYVMGVHIDEWTSMVPNRETGGCTWARRLTVEYPDWLPEWAVTKIKKAYTDESLGARAKDEKLFGRADCDERMLGCAGSAAFYQELGLADGSGLVYSQ